MAGFTVGVGPWPGGTVVGAYLASRVPVGATEPSGVPITTGTATGAGSVAFTDLDEQQRYVAFAAGYPMVRFSVPLTRSRAGYVSDRERLSELETAADSADLEGETVDTDEAYRIIMFSNGTVRAIPRDAEPPSPPTGLSALARLTSVRLTWIESAGAALYAVFRDGTQIGTTSIADFRDTSVAVSSTYSYRVQAIDQYGQRSELTVAVSAFIDPALNDPPTLDIRCWPAEIPTNGVAIVRVNAHDVDAQVLAIALDVDLGVLEQTADPSVWRLTI